MSYLSREAPVLRSGPFAAHLPHLVSDASPPGATRSRKWSWVFSISSFVLPVTLFAYRRWQLSEWLAQQDAGTCGLAFLAVLLQSLALALLLSLAALLFGLRSYLGLARPRPVKRLVETIASGGVGFVIVIASLLAWAAEAF